VDYFCLLQKNLLVLEFDYVKTFFQNLEFYLVVLGTGIFCFNFLCSLVCAWSVRCSFEKIMEKKI